MKKKLTCLAAIIWLFSMDVNAQDVSEYFYPYNKEVVVYEVPTRSGEWGTRKNCLFTMMNTEYFFTYEQIDLRGILKKETGTSTINEFAERLAIYEDRIESLRRVHENVLFGKAVYNSKLMLLVLPQVGKPVKIVQTEDNRTKYEYTFSLVTLTVDINNKRQDINAIKVIHKPLNLSPDITRLENNIVYWGKNLGEILKINTAENLVLARSAELTSSYYKEKGYYDVDKEKKRIEEEAEIARQKKEQEMINAFLAMRDTTVFSVTPDMSAYATYKQKLEDCVNKAVPALGIKTLNLHIVDDLTIGYNNDVQHNITITGLGSDNTMLVNAIKNSILQAKLVPLNQTEPVSKRTFPITSKGVFVIDYTLDSHEYDYRVIKTAKDVLLKKGDADAFADNRNYFASNLSKRGRYDLSLKVVDTCGVISKIHDVKEFRRPIDNVFIEYSYSPSAPVGITLGVNKIAYTRWGAYLRYKTTLRKTDDTKFEYITAKPKKDGYIRDAITGGLTFAMSKKLYLYAGAGYGTCAVAYSNAGIGYSSESGTMYYRASEIKGLEAEAGCRLRVWRFLGVSAGYSAIIPMSSTEGGEWGFGDVNFGVSLFF